MWRLKTAIFERGDKVFYYGPYRKYYGGIYKIVGKLTAGIWRLKGGDGYDFYARESELKKVPQSEIPPVEQLVFSFDGDRYLDDLM